MRDKPKCKATHRRVAAHTLTAMYAPLVQLMNHRRLAVKDGLTKPSDEQMH